MTADRATGQETEREFEPDVTAPDVAGNGVGRDVPPRRPVRRTAATAAAAAMDELDAEDSDGLVAGRSEAELQDIFDQYRSLPTVTAQALAEHVRGGPRIEDGKTHQMWDWSNADVCAVVRPMLQRRFSPLPRHRELSEDMGFDDAGNRIAREGGQDRIVAKAEDRFNDIWRHPSGTRCYGSGQGLLLPEAQLLRTRYWRLETDEVVEGRRAEDKRRNAAQITVFVLCLVAFAGLMVLILSL